MLIKKYLIVLITTALLIGACSGNAGTQTVKIAAGLPVSTWAQPLANAMQLALEQAGGKAGNIQVELVIYDTVPPGSDTETDEYEQKMAQQAIDDPAVVAYFGSTSSDRSKAIMPMLNRAGIVQISPSASWPGLTIPGFGPGEPGLYYPSGQQHFFRMGARDDVQGLVAARWVKSLGYKTAYLIDDSSVYATGLTGIFEVTAADEGIQIVGQESYVEEKFTEEIAAQIAARVITANPDVVYMGITSNTGVPLIGAIKKLDPELSIFTGDGIGIQLMDGLPAELITGIYKTDIVVAPADLKGEAASEFVKSYEAKYGEILDSNAGTAYEFMKMILHVIEQTPKPTRENILAGVTNMGEYTGIFGAWHFDENGDIVPAPVSEWEVKDGKWVFVEVAR